MGIRANSTETTITKVSDTLPELSGEAEGSSSLQAQLDALNAPHLHLKHVRPVPATPSYFSRVPTLNDVHIRIMGLFTKYHHLPVVPLGEAPPKAWKKIDEIRAELGEPVKAAYFSQVVRIAKRLNLVEPSVRPAELDEAIDFFVRHIDPMLNKPRQATIDRYGRAIAAGRRKSSSARAFVVEGTGEVQINGKSLSEAFGRVHDRESAIWALTSTKRLDKYNVYALVKGGGTTGQAEALTLAIAKALVAHEPALKTALRNAGCITRDPRTVERKKHDRKKARKGLTWVKR